MYLFFGYGYRLSLSRQSLGQHQALLSPMKLSQVILWLARLAAAAIMLQTLFFKFTGAPESVYIFSTVGIEPWGRLLTGSLELVASVLLLIPVTSIWGAVLTVGLMAGAIGVHFIFLGIAVQGDGGYLFFLAVITLACALASLWIQQQQVRVVLTRILNRF